MTSHRKIGIAVPFMLAIAIVFVSSAFAFAKSGSVAPATVKNQRSQTWVSAFSNPHWVYFPFCSCWSQVGDISYDSLAVNPVNLNNSPLKVSNPVKVAPTGFYPTTIAMDTYGRTKLAEVNVYQMNSSGTQAKLVAELTPPAKADGATISIDLGSGSAMQMVTFTRGGVPVSASSTGKTFPLADGIDFVAKRQAQTCADGLITPPVVLEVELVDKQSVQSAGRPVPMPCSSSYPNHITVTK